MRKFFSVSSIISLPKKIINRMPRLFHFVYYKRCASLLSNEKEKKIILFSFDCDNIEDIAALDKIGNFLEENKIIVTFAVPGEILLAGQEKFLKFSQAGHEFIGHGYKKHSKIVEGKYISTFFYNESDDKEVADDIARGNRMIKNLFGLQPRGFRIPHFGHCQETKEMKRLFRFLKDEDIKYSSSAMPVKGFFKGPLFRSYYSIYEMPLSGGYLGPMYLFDTFSYGFSSTSDASNYKDYLINFKKLIDFYSDKCVCLNLYSDTSQAAQMPEWFTAVKYAKEHDYKFMTLGEFYDKYKRD